MTTDPRISALRASHDRLHALAVSLTPEQLRQRAYPSEWTIAQVLSHLGSGAEIGQLGLDAGLSGAEPPSRDLFPTIWDRWNSKSPDEQATDALKTDTRQLETFEANADSTNTFASFMGPADIRAVAGMRLSEHAVHTWDIAVALDPAATVLPEALPFILDGGAFLVRFAAKPGERTELIRVITTGPDRDFALQLGAPSTLTPWSGEATPDATVRLPAEAFVRLMYGRLDPEHTPGGVSAEGINLDELRAIFPGF
jgi:uncharacterized protein (TIGR03083 family)